MTTFHLPFARTRRARGMLYLSGEVGLEADGTLPPDIGAQTRRTLARISRTLAKEGLSLADVVQVTAHLAREGDFDGFNAAYAPHFTAPLPVRTTVVAGILMQGALLELTVVAAERE